MNINDVVEVYNTGDVLLDGVRAYIKGFYMPEYAIIFFSGEPPVNYTPAIVMSTYCLKEVK